MSPDELAKKLDVHGAVIGRYEGGEVKPPLIWPRPSLNHWKDRRITY